MKNLLEGVRDMVEKYITGPVYFAPFKFNKHQIKTTYNGEFELMGDGEETYYKFIRNIFVGFKSRGLVGEAEDNEYEKIIIKAAKARQDTLIALSQVYNNMGQDLQEVYSKICQSKSKEEITDLVLGMDCRLLIKDSKRIEILLETYATHQYNTDVMEIMIALYTKQAELETTVKSLKNKKFSNNESSTKDNEESEKTDPEDDDEKH